VRSLRCYYYDHSDHYYSAKFTWLADEAYADQHTIARHRGYNMANEPANLPDADLSLKRAMFSAYGQEDGAVGPGPFNPGYENWLERQYDSDLSPAPVQPLCGILAFAQAPPTSATAGVALDPQPVIQLQDASRSPTSRSRRSRFRPGRPPSRWAASRRTRTVGRSSAASPSGPRGSTTWTSLPQGTPST